LNGSIVALYNGERNRVYVLNTREHTYYSTSLHGADTFSGRQVGTRDNSPMVVFQHPSAEKRQLIAGASASKYAVFGTSESSVEKTFSDASNDGFVKINGEIWASDAVELPTTNALIVSALSSLVAYGANELQQSLQAHLLEINEFPLKSTLETSRLNSRSQTTETTSVAFSVSGVSRVQLSDSLFEIPADYVQINGPASPSGSPSGGSDGWRAMAGRQAGAASATGPGSEAGGMDAGAGDGGSDDGEPGGPPPGGDGGGPGGPPPGGGPDGGGGPGGGPD
jgi:hypothetical protein